MFYNEPSKISYRNVANDLMCSEWKDFDLDIGNSPTADEFIEAIEEIGLSPLLLSMRAYHNIGEGLILDYGLRKQIWIPNVDNWDLSYFKKSLDERVENVELKPCPFCGSKAELKTGQELVAFGDDGFFIQCTNHECLMNTVTVNGGYSANPSDIIRKWNRRAGE